MMNLKIIILFFLFTWIMVSCNNSNEWQELDYIENLKCDSLHSEDAMYSPIKCRPYFEHDTLTICMSDLSWWNVTVKIYDGRFKTELTGRPFEPIELSFKTKNQRLQTGKKQYAMNDTLCGYFDFSFHVIDVKTNRINDWDFKGFICEVIREKGSDPFAGENFMNFDLTTAIHEMGEYEESYDFSMEYIPEFRIGLLNYFPANKDIMIKELTWDISPGHDISGPGQERLTVWYARMKDKSYFRNNGYHTLPDIWNNETNDTLRWLPVYYFKWDTNWQF